LPVIEVWRKVGRQIARDTPQTKGGEIYSNPHGFLDGLWYRQGSYSDRLGFLEGYIECMRSYVENPRRPILGLLLIMTTRSGIILMPIPRRMTKRSPSCSSATATNRNRENK
jgi:hypothetical protein